MAAVTTTATLRRNVMKPICGYERMLCTDGQTVLVHCLLCGHFLGALWRIDTLLMLKKIAKQTCEISFCESDCLSVVKATLAGGDVFAWERMDGHGRRHRGMV